MQTKKRVQRAVGKQPMFGEHFEVIAEAAAAAMHWVDGRIEDTASAKVLMNENIVVATRKFKAQLRRELKERGFDVFPNGRKWA